MVKVESVNKYAKFWFDENQIFNIKYHPSTVIDLEAAKFISMERKKLFNGKRYPILFDLRGLKFISKEASQYFSSEENTVLLTAGAFFVGSFFSKMMGNYYLIFFPPNRPTKLFTDKHEAIKWLLKYKQNIDSSFLEDIRYASI